MGGWGRLRSCLNRVKNGEPSNEWKSSTHSASATLSQISQTMLPSPFEVIEKEEGMVCCCGAKGQLITRERGMVRLKARADLFGRFRAQAL